MRHPIPISILAAVVLAVLMLSAGLFAGLRMTDLPTNMKTALSWAQTLRGNGWIALAALQILIAASGILPASLAGMVAGALYGVFWGFVLAAASTLAGALLTLLVTRSLVRDWIERSLIGKPRLRHLDSLLAEDGIRLVCLLRLSPVVPFAATSYALGLSSVTPRAYTVGTLASLPALLGYVYIGRLAADGLTAADASWLHWCMLAVSAGATLGLTLRIGQLLVRSGLFSADLRAAAQATLHRDPAPGIPCKPPASGEG